MDRQLKPLRLSYGISMTYSRRPTRMATHWRVYSSIIVSTIRH
jgi:hypothetical protein